MFLQKYRTQNSEYTVTDARFNKTVKCPYMLKIKMPLIIILMKGANNSGKTYKKKRKKTIRKLDGKSCSWTVSSVSFRRDLAERVRSEKDSLTSVHF